MTIVGWGKEKHNKLFGTNSLREANVPLVPHSECKQVYNEYYISDNMLCAGYKRGKIDSCEGDSGGPLLHRDPESNRWYIYGITSFGDGCGRKGKYGIYSMVPNYVDWIKNIFLEHLWNIHSCLILKEKTRVQWFDTTSESSKRNCGNHVRYDPLDISLLVYSIVHGMLSPFFIM